MGGLILSSEAKKGGGKGGAKKIKKICETTGAKPLEGWSCTTGRPGPAPIEKPSVKPERPCKAEGTEDGSEFSNEVAWVCINGEKGSKVVADPMECIDLTISGTCKAVGTKFMPDKDSITCE